MDGKHVGFMYREQPDGEGDSGWRFLAGDESESYLRNADNFAIYDVNTIANYDPAIVPLLDSPLMSAFEREPVLNTFKAVPFPQSGLH